MNMLPQFFDITPSTIFCNVAVFLLSNLVTGPRFMSTSSLVLELWQFLFIRDWAEIKKSEITIYKCCPISGNWNKLGILGLAPMSLIKLYWIMQNSRVTAFTVSESLKEKQQQKELIYPPPPLNTQPDRLGLTLIRLRFFKVVFSGGC